MALSDGRACKQYFRPFFLNEKKIILKINMVDIQQQSPQRLVMDMVR